MATAYFDESWTGEGSTRVFTFSTLVAPASRWEHFEVAWPNAMRRGGAAGKTLHMREFAHGEKQTKGEWQGWDIEKQTHLLKKLVPVVNDHVSWGLIGSLALQLYDDEVGRYTKEPKWRGTPFYVMLLAQMQGIVSQTQPTPENPVACVFEENREFEPTIRTAFYQIRDVQGWTDLFASIEFVAKRAATALQAADLTAYKGSHYASDWLLGKTTRDDRGSFLALRSNPRLMFKVVDRELLRFALPQLVTLDRITATDPAARKAVDDALVRAQKLMQRDQTARSTKGKSLPLDVPPSDRPPDA